MTIILTVIITIVACQFILCFLSYNGIIYGEEEYMGFLCGIWCIIFFIYDRIFNK